MIYQKQQNNNKEDCHHPKLDIPSVISKSSKFLKDPSTRGNSPIY